MPTGAEVRGNKRLEKQVLATAACGLGKGRDNRGRGHTAGKRSRAEGAGRFMVRVMSTAPAVMDGSAEKAAIPYPPPPLYRVHMGHP